MKVAKLVGDRFKERPADCEIDSHALMLRGGYMRYVANGIYSLYTPLRRITRKIEQIIREEMDAIDGQEVLFPVVLPASLWEESGRYTSAGSELLCFKDRNSNPLVLGMEHEEAAVQLVREYGQSYAKYPFMVYQIQTKFRDEARPRGGLIRAREFMVKDAYSFHTSREDLEKYYYRCLHAYERIFDSAGIPEVISVASDSGMMGGNISHEFILLTDAGEDSIAVCSHCDYRANMEAAESVVRNETSEASEKIALVHTPDTHTIEDLSAFLNMPKEKSCKAVVYQKNSTDEYVVLFIRGDLDANETKLKNYLGEDIRPADITEECGLNTGFIGPYNLKGDFIVLFDKSLKGTNNLSCGGNIPDHHYTGLQLERDCGMIEYHDFAKIKDGGICPKCGKHTIAILHGIEVGNILQLGAKYSQAMNMQYLDKEGSSQYPVIGCYGIGIGRLAAAVCEARHDAYGPIWPMSIAPWQVHICCIRSDNPEAKKSADELYEKLQSLNIEVIYDDRSVSTGVMFSDADLLGVPVRVIVSPRNMKENCLEITTRDKKISMKVSLDKAVEAITSLVSELMN